MLEVRHAGISKVHAVEAFRLEPPFLERVSLFIGDDVTDPEYDDIRQQLNAITGDIHACFAEYDWLPLR